MLFYSIVFFYADQDLEEKTNWRQKNHVSIMMN